MSSKDSYLVEVCENERVWLGGNFTKKGLLPNDRGPFSTSDGSLSWKTLEEAQDYLLTKGYAYTKDSSFTPADESDEWLYAVDFTQRAVARAQPKSRKGALHWVRFRRLIRPKRFDPSSFLPKGASPDVVMQCDHADSRAVDALSNKMLDVLTYLTMLQSPGGTVTDAVALPLKKRILDQLDQSQHISSSTPLVRLESLHMALEALAEDERRLPKYLLSSANTFRLRDNDPGWHDRRKEVDQRYWPERDVLAGWMARVLDPEFQLHCNVIGCGDTCEFCRVPCPNSGCPLTMSKKHVPLHDETCQYKRITCSCGNSFARHQKLQHENEVCPLRDTKCPFASIGCSRLLQAQDIPNHVQEETSSHMLLALNRILEVQDVIRDMNGKMKTLQDENLRLRQALEGVRTNAEKETSNVDKKITNLGKKLSALETSTQKEFRRIRDRSRERARSHVK